jgi:hypothetical protein
MSVFLIDQVSFNQKIRKVVCAYSGTEVPRYRIICSPNPIFLPRFIEKHLQKTANTPILNDREKQRFGARR